MVLNSLMNKTSWNDQMNAARALGPVRELELEEFVARLSAVINAEGHESYPECPPNWRVMNFSVSRKWFGSRHS